MADDVHLITKSGFPGTVSGISKATKYTVQWPEFWHEEFDYSDTEGGPIIRTDYVRTTHIQDKEFITKVATSKEACQIDLERQIAPITAKRGMWMIVIVVEVMTMVSLLAGPIGLVLMGATCALIVSVLKGDWFFNESEKAMLPASLKSVAKEAFLGILFLVMLSVLGIVIALLVSGVVGLITKFIGNHR